MSIAALVNIPGTDQELNQWAFAHAAHHRDCIRATFKKKGVQLNEYILDPMSLGYGFEQWIYLHQVMHNDMNAALGVPGFDLTDVNWTDPGNFSSFIQNNENEHYQWATILGDG